MFKVYLEYDFILKKGVLGDEKNKLLLKIKEKIYKFFINCKYVEYLKSF